MSMDVSFRDAIGHSLPVQVFSVVFLSYRTSYLFRLQGVTALEIPKNS